MTYVKEFFAFFAKPVKFHAQHSYLLVQAVRAEIKSMYAGSALGALWVIVAPLIFISLYASIYIFVFKIRPVGLSLEEYLLHIFVGLIPYTFFSNCILQSSSLFRSNPQVVFSTTFPSELLVSKTVSAHSLSLLAGFGILSAAAIFVKGVAILPNLLVLVLSFLLFIMFVVGLAWLVSLVGVVLKDFSLFLGYLMLLLLIATPISYTTDMLPESIRQLVYLNPFAHFVMLFQSLVSSPLVDSLNLFVTVLLESFFIFALGFTVYGRTKRYFFDFI